MINIVTFFWDEPLAKHKGSYEFTASTHVNKLARMLEKNLTIPYEFTCITDRPDDIDVSKVRILPMWDEFRDIKRCFTRIKVFSKEMKDVLGPRFACIDLDVVITGNVDHIFSKSEPFIGYLDTKNPRCYSGCFYIQDAGHYDQLYRCFRRFYNMFPEKGRFEWFWQNWNKHSDLVGSDQSWISEFIGPDSGVPKLTQDDGIYDYWSIEELPDLPENARMVFFNGFSRDASMPKFQEKHKWLQQHYVDV